MEEASAQHLSGEQFELLSSRLAGGQSQSEQDQNEYAQGELDRAVVHLESCELCRAKAKAYEAATMKLNRLNPVARPNQNDCPRADEWPLVATGATSPKAAREYLMHAGQCDHCGPLVRTTRAFDDEFSPEEELLIARLQTQPLEQRRLAETLRAKSQAGSRPLKPAPSRWISFKQWPVLAYGIATVVLATAVGLAVFFNARTESPDTLLAEAYSQRRTLEPRFKGARYGPVRILRGEHGQSSLNKPQALLDAESLIHRHLLKEPNSTLWLDAKGRVDLLEGNYDAALQTFEKVLDAEPDFPRWLTDAASAYFERGQLAGRPDDYGQAIELLGRALARSPDDPVALYNRALVNEKMFLYHQALEDWDHYLRIDPASDWADEAKRRRDAVRQKLQQQKQSSEAPLLTPAGFLHEAQVRGPEFWDAVDHREEDYLDQAIRVWLPMAFAGENDEPQRSALAALRVLGEILDKKHGDQWLLDLLNAPRPKTQIAAIHMLVSAAKSNGAADFAPARRASQQAEQLFARGHNTAGELRARFENIYALQLSNEEGARCLIEANSMTARLLGHRYPWLEAQLYMERSICQSQLAHFRDELQDLDKAVRMAEKSGYGTLKLRALVVNAEGQNDPDNNANAYLFNHQGLALYWDGVYPAYRAYQFYSQMALISERAARWNLALASSKEAVSAGTSAGQPLRAATARYRLSRYALMTGDVALAESESNQASRIFAGLPQNDVNRSYQADQEIRLAGLEGPRGEAEQAWAHLSRAQAQLPGIRNYFIELRYLKVLGSLQLIKGDRAAAEKTLRSAVVAAEKGLNTLRDERERAQWANESGDAYRGLAQIRWEAHDVEGALKTWEWYRGAPLRESRNRRADEDLAGLRTGTTLPPMPDILHGLAALDHETVVTFLQLPAGLITWAWDDRGVTAKWTAVRPQDLARLSRRFREECSRPDSDLTLLRRHAEELYNLMIAPIADRLSAQRTVVVEPDEAMVEVPLSVLVDSAGHYLSETYSIVLSPAPVYLRRWTRPDGFSSRQRALVIGSPALSGDLEESLEPLEDATREAREIASRFDSRVLLTGTAATVERVAQELPQAAIFHFAGHALAVRDKPVLLLANSHASPATATLDVERIPIEKLRNLRLAVFSACSTAKDERSSASPKTLVRLFLRAGVPHVVATRWSVDSSTTVVLMQFFYGALLNHQSVPAALKGARDQLRRLPVTAHPYYWAAFDAFGS